MYQKCVCFLFLVILAILSCSGFRIDSLAMTDLTKKNYHTSPNSYSNTDKYIRVESANRPHRIRHHRLWRTQAHNRYPKTPHIDAIVYPPPPTSTSSKSTSDETRFPSSEIWPYKSSNEPPREFFRPAFRTAHSKSKYVSKEAILPVKLSSSELNSDVTLPVTRESEVPSSINEVNTSLIPTNFPNENLAQIPPTDFSLIVSRSQRSPKKHRPNKNRKKNKWYPYQTDDIFSNAYKAKYVILVEVESKPTYLNVSNGSCQCYVKVIKDFKGNVGEIFAMVHKIYRGMITVRCDLVKEMKNSGKYLLLLGENRQPLERPRPKEKLVVQARKRINKVCKPGFVPTKPHIVELKEVTPKKREKLERKNRILICNVKGFPMPRITWRRKNEELHPNRSYNILYKRRRSKLVIRKPDAEYLGQYECVAKSLNGSTASKNFTLLPPQTIQECPEKHRDVFCENGGTCYYELTMDFYGCFCPENYSGKKCEMKQPSNTSMYSQPDLSPCKVGLSTKYNC